jgi:hypothetical protein
MHQELLEMWQQKTSCTCCKYILNVARVLCFRKRLNSWTPIIRNGMGIQTGIDLDKLIDAGSFISNVLDRESRSKVAKAMTAKRNQS